MDDKHKERLISENLVKHLAEAGGLVFCGTIVSRIVAFIFHVVLARGLGAASYGLYVLGQNIFDVIISVTSLGNGKGMFRFGAVYLARENKPKLKGTILSNLYLSLALSTFLGFFLFIFSDSVATVFFKKPALGTVLKLFSLALPFYTLVIMTTAVAITFHHMKYRVLIQGIFQPFTNLIFVIIAFFLGWHLYGAVAAFALSSFCCIPLGLYSMRKLFPEIFHIKGIYRIKEIILYSAPIILNTLLYFLFLNITRIILGIYNPAGEVAVYNVALKGGIFIMMFSDFFAAPFYPVIVSLVHTKNLDVLKKVYSLIATWKGWLSFIPLLFIICFSREFLLLFGKEYFVGKTILFILSLIFFLEAVPGDLRQLLEMGGGQRLELINSIAALALNVMLSLFMIPLLGILGASLSYFISVVFITIVRLIEIKKIFDIYPFSTRYIKFLVFAAFIVGMVVYWIAGLNLAARANFALVAFIAYCLVVYLLKSKEEGLVWDLLRSHLNI